MGIHISPAEAQPVMEELDADADGTISYAELAHAVQEVRRNLARSKAHDQGQAQGQGQGQGLADNSADDTKSTRDLDYIKGRMQGREGRAGSARRLRARCG